MKLFKRNIISAVFVMVLFSWMISVPLFAQDEVTPPQQNVTFDFSHKEPIKIVYPRFMAPYTFEDDTEAAQGLAVDLLRLWSKKTGIPVQFSSATWNDGLQMMRDGKADIHASLYYNEKRDAYLDYAAVVASSKGSLFFHKSISNLKSPGDLKGFRVGVVSGSYHEQYIRKHLPEVVLVAYPEFPKMLDAAQKGYIRVFVDDVGTTLYRLQKRGLVDEFRYNPSLILYSNNFWIAVREGDKKLAKALEEGMALITPEERAILEQKWLAISTAKTKDTLFIAMYSDLAPFTFINAEGRPAGLFVDIWQLWAEKTGKRVEFIPGNWKESIDNLKNGVADIHSGLFYSDTRAQWIEYSQPFYEAGSCFFYSGKQKGPNRKDDFAGKKVGVIKGSYYAEHLRKEHPAVSGILFSSKEKMLRAVLSGEISACLAEYLSTTALINRLGLQGKFDIEAPMLFTQKYYAGVLKNNTQLVSLINEGFEAITHNEMMRIEKHWVADNKKRQYGEDTQRIELTDSEIAWLAKHPKIEVGFSTDFPPLLMVEDDGYQKGYLPDLYKLLNRRLGTDIRIYTGPLSEIIARAKNKEIDGIAALRGLDVWRSHFDFTLPIIKVYEFIFTRTDTKISIQTLEDLHGRRVAYIDQEAGVEKLLSAHSAIHALPFSSLEEVMRALLTGQVDAVIGGSSTEYWRQQNLQFGITLSALIPESRADLVIGVRSDWPELTAIINKGLARISDGEMQTLITRWLGTVAPFDQKHAVIELSPEEQAWIAENHTIRVTFSEAPPYFSFKGGKVHGIAVDFLNTISENTGIKFQFEKKPYRFADELKGLKEHTGPDLVSAIMPTPEREKDILFTQLYIHSPRFIFTRDDSPFISSMENLFGKKVAVIKDYATHRYLVDNYPDIDLMVFATNEEALRAVSSGQAFAYIGDLISTPAMINEFGLKNLKAACPSGLPDHDQAMGIRNDWPQLRDILSKALEAIPADEKAAIMNRWTTVRFDHGTRPGEVRKWILIIVGISIVIVLFFIAWNRTLNRMVMEKTATLAESEQRFRATFEQAAVGIAHVSPTGEFRRVNKKFCDILGYSTEELVPKTFQEIIYPEDLDRELKKMEQLLAGETDMHSMDKRYIRKDGLPIWINSTVSLVRNEKGRPLWFMKVVEDISESKRIRAYRDMAYQVTQILGESGDLHQLLQRVVAVVKASTGVDAAGIRLQDGDDFPYFEQDGFSREFLAKECSLQGRNQDGDICRDYKGEPILECTCGLVISGKTDPANLLFTRGGSAWTNDALPLLDVPAQDDPRTHHRTHPRNECFRQGYASVALIPLRAGVKIVGLLQLNARRRGLFILPEVEILESIGEGIGTMVSRKRTDREITRGRLELAHMSRVSTMAELSTSLAHELNQPLSAILSNAQAGLRFMEGGNPDLKELAEILADIVADDKRAGDIIQKLRAFLRNAPPEFAMLDANIVVRDVLNILNSEVLIQGIKITTELAAEMPRVRADRVQLQQVLINIVVNAQQAMAGQEDDEPTVHIKTSCKDGNVVVSLQDTGPGVPEEALEQIFDPFYSTRNAGMGMGLAISRSIVTANGGQMWAENVSASGARFCVMLLGEFIMTKQEQTVFVVDDDDSVRKSLSRLFRSAGMTVETFASAQNFLDRAHFDGNGCLVLDLKMPGLSGHDLHRELLKADYSMPVVYLTGHGDIPTGVQAIKEGAVDFLTKPVNDQQLLDAVQAALGKDADDRRAHCATLRIRVSLSTLTAREYEVLTYVVSGMLNKQIAAALGISEATVKVHRGRVTEKLGVYSVAELVRLAETAGVLPADVSDP